MGKPKQGKNKARKGADQRQEDAAARKRADRERRRDMRKKRQREKYEGLADLDQFGLQLRPLGLRIVQMGADGNCLFRTLADQLYGSESGHREVREAVVRFMRDNEEDFAPFMEDDEPFEDYLERMLSNAEWGGNQELCAAARMECVNIVVHQFQAPRFEITIAEGLRTLHVAYVGEMHYDSVRRSDDPLDGEPPLPIDLTAPLSASAAADAAAAPPPPLSDDASLLMQYAPWASRELAERALELADGDVDSAVELLVAGLVELPPSPSAEASEAAAPAPEPEPAAPEPEPEPPKPKRGGKQGGKRNRSSPCHCGSGIKYKECCRKKDLRAERGLEEPTSSSSAAEPEEGAVPVDVYGSLSI